MAKAEIERVIPVSKENVWNVITDYANYPEFVDGCTRVEVGAKGENKIEVEYFIHLIKEISYRLKHDENLEAGQMSWSLLESDFLKSNNGKWTLESIGKNETSVRYEIELEFKIPVPGLILKKLVKGSLPNLLENIEKRAKDS